MTSTPTTTKVLDGFLRRARVASGPESSARTADVVARFRDYLDRHGPKQIDDLTAYRLTHDRRQPPTDPELAAVLAVIEHVTGFFRHLEAGGAPPCELALAADVMRDVAVWLTERRLVDTDVASHLDHYTLRFVGHQQTGS